MGDEKPKRQRQQANLHAELYEQDDGLGAELYGPGWNTDKGGNPVLFRVAANGDIVTVYEECDEINADPDSKADNSDALYGEGPVKTDEFLPR